MRHPRHAPVNFALAALALGPLAVAPAGAPADAQTPTGASVLVVKAGSYCFSATVRVAGHVVPRAEAIVNLDADGYQISEVLVAEGEQVKAGQTLAKLTLLGYPCLPKRNRAKRNAIAQQWYSEHGAILRDRLIIRHGIFGVGRCIKHVDRAPFQHSASSA
jgi:hypothetical protein